MYLTCGVLIVHSIESDQRTDIREGECTVVKLYSAAVLVGSKEPRSHSTDNSQLKDILAWLPRESL